MTGQRTFPPAVPTRRSAAPAAYRCEAEIVEGLEEIAAGEIAGRFGARVVLGAARRTRNGPANLPFTYTGDLAALTRLKTVSALFLVHHVPVPRPRAILANHHFRDLLADIAHVRALAPEGAYRTFYLSAAGADSEIMVRFKTELAVRTGLALADEEGDLYLRLRRPPGGGEGWEALIRLTPRPLATRSWRVRNLAGALNATVAHAMVLLTDPTPHDLFLNLCCGTGTLLIERAAWGPAARVAGCDIDTGARADAAANIAASRVSGQIEVYDWDARAVPLPERSVHALVADLPFGIHMGSHGGNVALYPAILAEAARVARRGARFAAMTPEMRLMESVLPAQRAWAVERTLRVNLNGLYPRIFVLRRV